MRDQAFGPMGSPRYLGYARDIHASGRVLGSRIDTVMDLIRLDAGLIKRRRGSVDVTAALDAVLAQAEASGHGPAELALDLPDSCPVIRGDRWAVERIFSLLLAGAAGKPATLRVAVEDGKLSLAWNGAAPDACGQALLAALDTTMTLADNGLTLTLPIAAPPRRPGRP
jgi:two-component system cell cycle sensor histidine kinase PleC